MHTGIYDTTQQVETYDGDPMEFTLEVMYDSNYDTFVSIKLTGEDGNVQVADHVYLRRQLQDGTLVPTGVWD